MIPNIMIQWNTRENKKWPSDTHKFFVDRKYRRRPGVENRDGGDCRNVQRVKAVERPP